MSSGRRSSGTRSATRHAEPGPGSTAEAPQPAVAAAGLAALALLAWLARGHGWRMAVLAGIGALQGVVLYQALFGFTAAYRRLLVERDGRGVEAQLLMLAVASALFAPALAEGTLLGRGITGSVSPVGAQVAIGAFLFGVGMQLGGGCGSGTLFTIGGGSTRMVITLTAFCAGSFRASLDMGFWATLPRWPRMALGEMYGWSTGLALQLGLIGLLWLLARAIGGRASPSGPGMPRPAWGGVALAVLNWLTLGVAGHAWSIAWAFTLWGAKTARLLGWNPATAPFWQAGFPARALDAPILADTVSVMDIGIVTGALVAAGIAGRFRPALRVPPLSLAAAVIGGLLLGYGSRIAFGCNIGAFFSGVASTSLHGWLWILAALPGNWLGVRLRPLFRLDGTAAARLSG
jgi:uncharacterized protein